MKTIGRSSEARSERRLGGGPRLVGAFVLTVGLLVAGMAVGLGPAAALINQGGSGSPIPTLNWDCDADGLCHCDGRGGVDTADCRALQDANPDCEGWMHFGDHIYWCQVPDGEPVFHPSADTSDLSEDDVTPDSPEEDTPPLIDPDLILGPGDLEGQVDSGGTGPDQPEDPDTPEDPVDPDGPEAPEEPTPDLPPGLNLDDAIGPEDLPGAEDPGRTGGTGGTGGSNPLDPGGFEL